MLANDFTPLCIWSKLKELVETVFCQHGSMDMELKSMTDGYAFSLHRQSVPTIVVLDLSALAHGLSNQAVDIGCSAGW